MSGQNNPYATGTAGGYQAKVSYGAAEPSPGRAELIRDTTTASFTADVIRESRRQPVLVDFWAPWCGPCRQLTPLLEKVVVEAAGAVKLVKMNIDEHPSIAGQLGIQSIPAVVAFRDGQPVDAFTGAVPESQVREFVRRVGGKGNMVAQALEAAAAAAAAGDAERAGALYSAVLERAPDNAEAIAGLAALLLDAGDEDAAKELIASAPEEARNRPPLAGVATRIALAEEVRALGDPVGLERRLAADPKDHAARFDLAMIQNARGEREAAADNLLAIVRADRSWRDDGAKAQLLKFFEAWGPTDPATLAARRRLSSLLFA